MTWQDIGTAKTIESDGSSERVEPVLMFNSKTGDMRVGVVHEYVGVDGISRRGIRFGLCGIWIASHWMPLPEPPQ